MAEMKDWLLALLDYLRYLYSQNFILEAVLGALWLSMATTVFSMVAIVWTHFRLHKMETTLKSRPDSSGSSPKAITKGPLFPERVDAESDRANALKKLCDEVTKATTRFDETKTLLTSRLDRNDERIKAVSEEGTKRFEGVAGSISAFQSRLAGYDAALEEEREWFERITPIVHPRTASDLIHIGGGFFTSSPERWAGLLEKRWNLLRQNAAFRTRILALWGAEPVQRIGAHYRRLLKISREQYAAERLAAGGVPPRLGYWRNLHLVAIRHFVGVHNFFTRVSRMNEPGHESFASSIRGMTHAEQEIGWAHITDPPQSNVSLAGSQLEDYIEVARRALVDAWLPHALRLHQEIFDVANYERRDRGGVLDELDQIAVDGDGIVEEDVRAAGRHLGFDLIDIPIYGEVSMEISSFVNSRATQHKNIHEWLGYQKQIGKPVVLRLKTLAWKRRQSAELLHGGAEIIVGRDADA